MLSLAIRKPKQNQTTYEAIYKKSLTWPSALKCYINEKHRLWWLKTHWGSLSKKSAGLEHQQKVNHIRYICHWLLPSFKSSKHIHQLMYKILWPQPTIQKPTSGNSSRNFYRSSPNCPAPFSLQQIVPAEIFRCAKLSTGNCSMLNCPLPNCSRNDDWVQNIKQTIRWAVKMKYWAHCFQKMRRLKHESLLEMLVGARSEEI